MDSDIDKFAKKITNHLGKDPVLDDHINQRLSAARNIALSKAKYKRENFFQKYISNMLSFSNVSIVTACACFSFISLIFLQDQNDLIFDDNLLEVSQYIESSDEITTDTQHYLIDEFPEEEINQPEEGVNT